MNIAWGSQSCNAHGDRREPEGTISLGLPARRLVSGLSFVRGVGGGLCRSCGNPTTQLLSNGLCGGCGGTILPPLSVPYDRGR